MSKLIIALFANEDKPHSLQIAKEIAAFLHKKGVMVVTDEHLVHILEAVSLNHIEAQAIDFRICLGGDGTILRLVHRHPQITSPLLGINLGSLGFLADIPIEEIYPSLQLLLDGKYKLEKRMLMEGFSSNGDKYFAINEVTIHRAMNRCLIELAIYVDGLYLNTFAADGVILSTPSGSTAYSLSAGGPILTPELQAFVLTPICPHTISNRPIVLMPENNITIHYKSPYQPVEVSYDGLSSFNLSTHDELVARRSNQTLALVTIEGHDYYSTLREKLGWHGKLKNNT